MGKGDPRTRRGKIYQGSFGKSRVKDPAKRKKKAAKAAQQQAGVDAVKESVNANLDSLKEDVFRLELRKQAGTISEEDYAREKSRVEKLLRDLVRG